MEDNKMESSQHHDRDLQHINYSSGCFMKVRNLLNMAFIILAVVGMIIYFSYGQSTGMTIMLAGVVIKIIETFLRFIH